MHLPMSRSEIAEFLNVSSADVELFWQSGQLRRSLCCPCRPISSLNYSTVYDVLECTLTLHKHPFNLSKDSATRWIELLAETDDLHSFENASAQKRTTRLADAAMATGLAAVPRKCAAIAKILICEQAALVRMCKVTPNDFGAEASAP